MRTPRTIAATTSHLYCLADDGTIWVKNTGTDGWTQLPSLPDGPDASQNPFLTDEKASYIRNFENAYNPDWGQQRNSVWVKGLKLAGAQIGPNNWQMWATLVMNFKQANVEAACRKASPGKRWPSDVETILLAEKDRDGSSEDVF